MCTATPLDIIQYPYGVQTVLIWSYGVFWFSIGMITMRSNL